MISVIAPVYNEEESLEEFNKRTLKVLRNSAEDFEIIYIDDGSKDKSLEIIKNLCSNNKEVKFISFYRNFGQHAAVLAGFKNCKGDYIITLDTDLQNPPEETPSDSVQEKPSAPVQEKPSAPVHETSEPVIEIQETEPSNTSKNTEVTNEVKEVQFVTKVKEVESLEKTDATTNSVTTVQEVLGDMMGDAPACPDCGHITIRNGSCYKCLNCGNSLGCS